jgi:uncharacterized protein YigA (DUF484 family)
MSNPEIPALDSSQVAQWLTEHPEFFIEQPDLLRQLVLPHPSGQAVSLLEKQNALLREDLKHAQTQLHTLMTRGRRNDQLFHHLQELILAMLQVETWPDRLDVLGQVLRDHFGIEHWLLLLNDERYAVAMPEVQVVSQERLGVLCPHLSEQHQCWVGAGSTEVLALVANTMTNASQAQMMLQRDHQTLGVLVLVAQDPGQFEADMDTLFLEFLAQVLAALAAPADGEF